jgi:hypothetical protein
MTADNQPGKGTRPDNKGDVRPSTDKNEKLGDKIAAERDDELAVESASDERKSDS